VDRADRRQQEYEHRRWFEEHGMATKTTSNQANRETAATPKVEEQKQSATQAREPQGSEPKAARETLIKSAFP